MSVKAAESLKPCTVPLKLCSCHKSDLESHSPRRPLSPTGEPPPPSLPFITGPSFSALTLGTVCTVAHLIHFLRLGVGSRSLSTLQTPAYPIKPNLSIISLALYDSPRKNQLLLHMSFLGLYSLSSLWHLLHFRNSCIAGLYLAIT